MKYKNTKGFTLIELLIVIGIIAILAGIVLVAVNPAQQFGKANDSERKSEIGTVLSAIYQFQTSPTARLFEFFRCRRERIRIWQYSKQLQLNSG